MDWQSKQISVFVADDGTEFHRGPFEFEGRQYDFKLKDGNGIDYCTERQMENWQVKIKRIIQVDELTKEMDLK